jgi:hypothetical protein
LLNSYPAALEDHRSKVRAAIAATGGESGYALALVQAGADGVG